MCALGERNAQLYRLDSCKRTNNRPYCALDKKCAQMECMQVVKGPESWVAQVSQTSEPDLKYEHKFQDEFNLEKVFLVSSIFTRDSWFLFS